MLTVQAQNKAVAGTEDALLSPSAFAVAWQQADCLLNSPVYQVDLHARCVNNLGNNINLYALGPNSRKFMGLFNNVCSAQRPLSVQTVGGIGNVNPLILTSAVAGGGWGWQLKVQTCRCAVATMCCCYNVLLLQCAVATVCCCYNVLLLQCAVAKVCCCYSVLLLQCAVAVVSN